MWSHWDHLWVLLAECTSALWEAYGHFLIHFRFFIQFGIKSPSLFFDKDWCAASGEIKVQYGSSFRNSITFMDLCHMTNLNWVQLARPHLYCFTVWDMMRKFKRRKNHSQMWNKQLSIHLFWEKGKKDALMLNKTIYNYWNLREKKGKKLSIKQTVILNQTICCSLTLPFPCCTTAQIIHILVVSIVFVS